MPVAICTGSTVFRERQDAGSGYVQDVRYFARGMDAGSKDVRNKYTRMNAKLYLICRLG